MESIEYHEIDDLFAAYAGSSASEEERAFFRRLMAHSRKGNLCLASEQPIVSKQIVEGTDDDEPPLLPIVHCQGHYYLQRNWVLETTILRHLRRLQQTVPSLSIRPVISSSLNARQSEAIQYAAQHALTVITGGPGTGKTFTAGHMIQTFMREAPLRIKIAALTGKAADRLAQTVAGNLKIESLTLHRLLSLQPGQNRLFHTRSIAADLIIVDEASMIDAALFAHLLAAVPDGARLVLLGDADQLPPIDGGGIFSHLAATSAVRLEECRRTDDEAIQMLYQAVRTGNVNPLYTILEPLPTSLIDWVEPLLGTMMFDQRPDPAKLFKQFDRMRLISPLRRGPWGVDTLNETILRHVQQKLSVGQWWAAPLILTNNDPSLQLYNGSSALVIGQYSGQDIMNGREDVLLNDGRSLILNQLPGYEPAFALSVHKSQGSEYEQVICLLPPGSEQFAREALYTALTRAKQSVRLLGDRTTLQTMMECRSQQQNGLAFRR